MRYVVASVLLLGCSGDGFRGRPIDGSGGTTGRDAGHAQSGGTPSVSTGGVSASGGAHAVDAGARDASADAGPDVSLVPITQCPVTPPDAASPCAGTLDCSYGDHPWTECRPTHRCRSGRWYLSTTSCEPARFCAEYAPPASTGAACATAGDACKWGGGDLCECVAGAWKCAPRPSAPCPPFAPNQGQPCGDAGASCAYGLCGGRTGVVVSCEDGVVAWQFPLCN